MLVLLFFLEASFISFLLTGAILRYSLRRSLLDMPTDRGSHRIPKPRLGGVAIVAAFYLTILTSRITGSDPLPGLFSNTGVLGAAAMIALVGLLDDLRGLDAKLKLAAQLIAAGMVVASGVVLEQIRIPLVGVVPLGPAAIPLTVLWITAIVNFYNFVDGLDGLAAGVGVIAAAFLVLLGYAVGDPTLAIVYAAVAGVLFGFLRYNFPPARIFMGDCGSTFIGFLFAVLAVVGSGHGVPVFATLLLMGGVLGDAALTLVRRAIQRKPLFTAHRTHYYQRLTDLDLSHKQVTLLEYFVATLLGGSAFLLIGGDSQFVAGLSAIWTGFFLWAVFKIRSMEKGGEPGSARRIFAAALTDLVLVAASYFLSYMIRLNFSFPTAETRTLVIGMPLVLVIRSVVFYYYGLYKAVWRYTTFDDIVRIFKAVAVGTVIMVVLFTFLFRFESFPRSVFLIDLFILTVFMAGARVVTRWFHELPAHEEVEGRRVVIGETGHVAEAILHRVKRTKGLCPVGWLDDRRSMHGRMIHGLPVLGSIEHIESISARHGIDEVLISSSYAMRVSRERVDQLDRYGVPVRVLSDTDTRGIPMDAGDPFAGRRIIVAGNGPVARDIAARSGESSEISVLTDDPSFALEHAAGTGNRGRIFLGLLEDRGAVARLIREIGPDMLVADLSVRTAGLANPTEAYMRKVVMPLERLASGAAATGTRMILISWSDISAGDAVGKSPLFAESVVRNAFRGIEERLAVLRPDETSGAGTVSDIAGEIASYDGGIWVIGGGDNASKPVPEKVQATPVQEDVAAELMEISRALIDGDAPRIISVLSGFESSASLEENESR